VIWAGPDIKLRHGTGRGASGLQRQALEPAADPALCGGMAL